MKNTINKDTMAILRCAMRESLNGITVMEEFVFDNNEPLTWTVNWGCKGATSPEEADEYARWLIKASQLASYLNELEIYMVWENDKAFIEKVAENPSESEEEAKNMVSAVKYFIEAQMYPCIAEVLLNR